MRLDPGLYSLPSDGLALASEIMPPGNSFGVTMQICRTFRIVLPWQSSLLLYICDWPSQSSYCDNLHWMGTVHVLYSYSLFTISPAVPTTVMSKVTQHIRTMP